MAVSIKQLADALRVDNPEDDAVLENLTHWLRAAREIINVRSTTAPIAIADASVIRLASYLYDQPTTSKGQTYGNALINSGAGSLLGPWIVRRLAGAVEDGLIVPTPAVDTYGIASGWLPGQIVAGIPSPVTSPMESAFTEHGTGLEIPIPVTTESGYLLTWLEDRTPGNPVTILEAVIVRENAPNTQMTFQADAPYPYSLNGQQGHLWVSGSVLVSLSQLFGAATIRIGIGDN